MTTNFSAIPDAERFPSATAVTPADIKAAEDHWRALAAADRAVEATAAYAEFQRLCQAQTEQLRQIYLQRQISQMLKTN